jgi:hypothetical protein
VVILCAASVFYAVRFGIYASRLLSSWRAGLVSGGSAVWFIASAAAFSVLSIRGDLRALLLLAIGAVASVVIFFRDVSRLAESDTSRESEPDNPILRRDEEVLDREPVVLSIVRATVKRLRPGCGTNGRHTGVQNEVRCQYAYVANPSWISNIPFFKMRNWRRSLLLTKKRFKEVIGGFEGCSGTADAAP